MKTLFKTLFVFLLFFVVTESHAQISVGGGLWYGTDINNVGFSINGKYQINEKIAATPAFTYFLKKDYLTLSTLDLNGTYNITEFENVGSLYGIGGLGLTFLGVDFDNSVLGEWAEAFGGSSNSNTTEFGVNVGAGFNIGINEKLSVSPEAMYTFGGVSYLRIGAKIMFAL